MTTLRFSSMPKAHHIFTVVCLSTTMHMASAQFNVDINVSESSSLPAIATALLGLLAVPLTVAAAVAVLALSVP